MLREAGLERCSGETRERKRQKPDAGGVNSVTWDHNLTAPPHDACVDTHAWGPGNQRSLSPSDGRGLRGPEKVGNFPGHSQSEGRLDLNPDSLSATSFIAFP